MIDLTKRIAELPSNRRSLLEQLLAKQARPEGPSAQSPASRAEDGAALVESLPSGKDLQRRFYDTLNGQLNAGDLGEYSRFLNLGYVSHGSGDCAAVALPKYCLNKNSMRLVVEVVGDAELADEDVLDVGCGRGGTAGLLDTYFHPGTIAGVDLSYSAIAFCRDRNRSGHVRFLEGDAENLPFSGGTFGAVTNIESSCTYPNVQSFYSEVARVLRPGGCLLYTDMFTPAQWDSHVSYLNEIGFVIEVHRDISRNVLLSCDEVAASRLAAFNRRNDQATMNDFLAVPGSSIYESINDGHNSYRILRLRKA